MANTWGQKIIDALPEISIDDARYLLEIVIEARAAAGWWQAQCQGRDAVIEELRACIKELRERVIWLQDRMEREESPVLVGEESEGEE